MKLKDNLNTEDMHYVLRLMAAHWNSGTAPGKYTMQALIQVAFEPDLPPMQPPIPWEYVDERYNYVAMDSGGGWVACVDRPDVGHTMWNALITADIPCPKGADRPWTETLCIRPGAE